MAVALGVLVAAAFGSGDFFGGRAAASAATARVLVLVQFCSVCVLVVVVFLVSAQVAPSDIVLGLIAGAANVGGLALLYRGLASNAAGVVAPVTAMVAALVPVTWGLARGERPSVVVLLGAAAAIAAGGLIAREPERATGSRLAGGALQAIAAGGLLGSSLVLFSSTSDRSGMWPVFAARASAFAIVAIAVLWIRARGGLAATTGQWRLLAVAAGVLDAAATVLLLLAVRRGLIVVVAPVSALAPAFTVGLAWSVMHERLHREQIVGLMLGLVGLILVAAG